jgi:STE24 endopeptidase
METFIIILIYGLIIMGFAFNTWLSILNYKNRNAKIPEEVADVYDEEKYQQWLKYNMETFRFSSIVRVVNIIVFLLMLILGVYVFFNDIALNMSNNATIQIIIFMGLYYLVSFVIGIFTSYYRAFTIEEKYGFNKMTKKTFIFDKIKGLALMAVFGGGIVILVFTIYDKAGQLFFLYTWLALVTILLLVNILYTKLILPLFNKLTNLPDGELKDAILALAKKVGYEISQISVMDASKRSSKLNAFFSGFGKFKKIVLFDTLVDKMSTDEVVSVLAHEIGHNKHKHIIFNLIQTSLTLLLYIGAFALILGTDVFSTSFGFDSANFGFSIILFSVLMSPFSILLELVTSYFSRKHEYQADRFAAIHNGKDHIESSLKVLSRENFSNLTPHPLYVKLTYSHPPTVDRIRAIRKVD